MREMKTLKLPGVAEAYEIVDEQARRNQTAVTPQMFGAVGDGLTNDTAAFQAAVDSGRDVTVPEGHYRVGGVNITRPVTITGAGDVRLQIPDGVDLPALSYWTEATTVFIVRATEQVKLENLCFDGNQAWLQEKYAYGPLARYDAYGVRIRDESKNVTVSRCRFENLKDAGVQITARCAFVTVENCRFFAEGWPGTFNRGVQILQSEEPHDAYHTIRGNHIENTGEHGIVVYYNNDHCVIDGNRIRGAGLLEENPDGSANYTSGCCIKASGASFLTVVNNCCDDAIDACIGLYGTRATFLRENIVANNTCIGSSRAGYKGSGIACEGGSVIVTGNVIRDVRIRKYSQSSAIVVNTADAVITGNRIEACDTGIRSAGAPVTGNHVQAGAPLILPVCADITVANNTLIGDGTQDGISLYGPENVTVNGNVISNVRYGIMGRTSANNVNIYGNVFQSVSRAVNWYGFTPENTRIDFELQYTTDLDKLQTAVRNGTAAATYPVGTRFLVPYTLEDKTYTFAWHVADYQNVTLQDGSEVPGMVLQAAFATVEMPVFDAAENEVATEAVFTQGYYYYLADSSMASGYALQTGVVYGDPIPTDKVYYHSGIRDNTGRIVATGCSSWARSSIRQWLNSAKPRGSWWTAQHPGDLPAEDAETLDGFMAGFRKDFLKILQPVKVSTYDWTAAGVQDTWDTFFLPSLEQIYAEPVSQGEGSAFAYWKQALGTDSPTVYNSTHEAYVAAALEDGHTARTWKLRTHGSNRYTTYVTHHTGRWTTVVPNGGHYVLPVCVVC